MQRYFDVAQDQQGNAIPNAQVTVYTSGVANPLPIIYAASGSLTAPAQQNNPITTDANGAFSFAAPNGQYDIQISGGSAPTITKPNIILFDCLQSFPSPALGTVTSVGLSLPAPFSVSGSPVTSAGTLTGSLASQTANFFWAAPNGSSGAPTFRAIVSADLPASGVSSGTYQSWTSSTGALVLTAFTVDQYGRVTNTGNNSITVPQYGNQGTWTKAQNVAQVTATFAGTTTLDLTASNGQVINAASNFTLAVSGGVAGGTYCVKIVQTVANSIVTWPATFKWPGGSAGVLSTALNSIDLLTMYFDGTNYLCTLQKAYA